MKTQLFIRKHVKGQVFAVCREIPTSQLFLLCAEGSQVLQLSVEFLACIWHSVLSSRSKPVTLEQSLSRSQKKMIQLL